MIAEALLLAGSVVAGPPPPPAPTPRITSEQRASVDAHTRKLRWVTYGSAATAAALTEVGLSRGHGEANPLMRSRAARLVVKPLITVGLFEGASALARSDSPKLRQAGRIMQHVTLGLSVADAGWDFYVVVKGGF